MSWTSSWVSVFGLAFTVKKHQKLLITLQGVCQTELRRMTLILVISFSSIIFQKNVHLYTLIIEIIGIDKVTVFYISGFR